MEKEPASAFQGLLRHDTLQLIKLETLYPLVSCPELKEMLTKTMKMNKQVLELLSIHYSQ